MIVLGFALAALIGLALGLLGGGGSILTVPVLVYVLGYSAKSAIAMSLPVVGVTSLVGASFHWRRGNVRFATAATFGALAIPGAFVGARLTRFMTGGLQLGLLAIIMLVAAASMLRSGRAQQVDGAAEDGAESLAFIAPVAFSVGLITGIVGIGGGFLVVPALVLLAKVPMREAVGTSLVVITMNSASGFAGYLGTVAIDWGFLAGFTAVAIVGVLCGSALSRRVPQATLKRGFAVFLVAVGTFVLYRNSGL
jgi:uncharacterized protein